MESNPSNNASEKWSEVIPKIWKIAGAENSPNIVVVLDELGDSMEEGKISFRVVSQHVFVEL